MRPADLVRSSAPYVVTEMTSAQSQQRPLYSPINSCEQQEGSSQGLYHHHFLYISLGPDSAPLCNSPRALREGMQSGIGGVEKQLGRAPWHTTDPSSSHRGQTQSGKRKPESWLSTDGSKHPGCQSPAPFVLGTHLAELGVLGLALSMPRSPFEPSPEALPASSWTQGEQGSWTLNQKPERWVSVPSTNLLCWRPVPTQLLMGLTPAKIWEHHRVCPPKQLTQTSLLADAFGVQLKTRCHKTLLFMGTTPGRPQEHTLASSSCH